MESGLKLWGILGASAIILSNNSPTLVKAAARLAKVVFGARIQICDGVADNVEIQVAADTLPSGGGKLFLLAGTYDITAVVTIPYYTTIEGEGPSTILKANASLAGADFQIITNADKIAGGKHIVIRNLLIDGNDVAGISMENTCGILLENADDCIVEGVYTKDCWGKAIRLNATSGSTVRGCIDSGSNGAVVIAGHGTYGASERCTVVACMGEGNDLASGVGANFCGVVIDSIISGCTYSAYQYGIFFFGAPKRNIIGTNTCYKNGFSGIGLASNADDPNDTSDNTIVGNNCYANSQETDNTYANITLGHAGANGYAHRNHLIGNTCRRGALANKSKYGIEIQLVASKNNIIRENSLEDSGSTSALYDAGALTEVNNNRGSEITDEKVYKRVKNTSGGALVAGDVVILKAVAAGNEITTTTTKGDDSVYGMVAESINNNAYGLVQVGGWTTALKVNGVVDIAIGDPLGTYTAAGIAMKAAAGDQAFARALEAYATDDSNGVIDAYIKSPWD